MDNVSPWLLLTVSMFACLASGISRNYYCKLLAVNARSYYLLNGSCGAVCAVLLWAMGGFGLPAVSPFTLWLGVVFGLVTMTQGISNAAALRAGPWAYTSVITSLATIIPALSGVLFWNESIGVLQVLGMLLMIGCFVLSVDAKAGSAQRKASLHWLVLCLIAFLCTGLIGVMQKIHQSGAYREELSGFLIVAFLVSASCSLLVYAFYPQKNAAAAAAADKSGKKLLLVAGLFVLMGVATAINNQFNLYLSGVMPSVVFFPIVNGGGLVLATLASVVLFREKLSGRQWVGLALGTASVLCLCL